VSESEWVVRLEICMQHAVIMGKGERDKMHIYAFEVMMDAWTHLKGFTMWGCDTVMRDS
jgi:hypothetical protein